MRSLGPHPRGTHALALLVAFGVAAGCSASSDKSGSQLGPGSLGDASNHHTIEAGSGAVADAARARGQNPLCGNVARFCRAGGSPDDPTSCHDFDGGSPVRPPGTGGARSFGQDSGRILPDAGAGGRGPRDASFEGSFGGRPPIDDAGAADATADAAPADAAGPGLPGTPLPQEAGAPPEASVPGAPRGAPSASPPSLPAPGDAGPRFSCQVSGDVYGNPTQRCLPAGGGGVASPCAASSDCRAGLACVGSEGAGQCLPYCCALPAACSAGTFCAVRPLLEGGRRPALEVPVCAPADGCRLDEPYPCDGPTCRCSGGTTCAVVSKDGKTGCVKPGSGRTGEACTASNACAAGYQCSQALAVCVKTCKTGAPDGTCAPGKCQAAAGFPPEFGVCVGLQPAAK